jgi:WD40 domain-containing protein
MTSALGLVGNTTTARDNLKKRIGRSFAEWVFSPQRREGELLAEDDTKNVNQGRRTTLGPFAHPGPVWAVAASPDGEEIVTGGNDGTARVWNHRSGEERLVLRGHDGPILAVAITPDGEEIVTGGNDGTARVWNRRSGEERLVLRGHAGSLRAPRHAPTAKIQQSDSKRGNGPNHIPQERTVPTPTPLRACNVLAWIHRCTDMSHRLRGGTHGSGWDWSREPSTSLLGAIREDLFSWDDVLRGRREAWRARSGRPGAELGPLWTRELITWL